MKSGWEIKLLGEICDFQNGFAFKSDLFRENGNAVLRISNIQNEKIEASDLAYFCEEDYKENFERYRVVKGDLVIAMSGATTGKIGFNTLDDVFYLNQRVGMFKPKATLLKTYLFYFLSSRVEENLRISAGAAQPNLSTEQIKSFEIPLPPIPEQQRIVTILDEVFEGIATAKANAEKNLANARELFESEIHSIFNGAMKAEWQAKKLGEVCQFKNGQAHEQFIDENGEYILVNSKFISSNGTLRKRTNKMLSPLYKGDIVFVMSDVPGGKALAKCFLIDADNTYSLNQRIGVIRSQNYDKKFLYYHLNRHPFLLSFNNGENQTNLRKNDILNCPVFLPSIKDQLQIVKLLDDFSYENRRLEAIYQQKLTALEELKKAILNQAFSGQLN